MEPILTGIISNIGLRALEKFLPQKSQEYRTNSVNFEEFLDKPQGISPSPKLVAEKIHSLKNDILNDPQLQFLLKNSSIDESMKIEIRPDGDVWILNDLGDPKIKAEGSLKENLLEWHALKVTQEMQLDPSIPPEAFNKELAKAWNQPTFWQLEELTS